MDLKKGGCVCDKTWASGGLSASQPYIFYCTCGYRLTCATSAKCIDLLKPPLFKLVSAKLFYPTLKTEARHRQWPCFQGPPERLPVGPLPQGQLPGQALKWRKVLKSCLSPHWGLPFLLSLCAEPSLAVKGSCTECTPWAHSKLRLLGVPAAQLVKNPPAMWRTWVRSLGWEDPLEKGKATRSIILVWRIPWTV